MGWQELVTYLVGALAAVYVVRIFIRQLKRPETDPRCEDCPLPERRRQAAPPK